MRPSRLVHRVWQKLPQHWRRAALFQATAALAPRPDSAAAACEPMLVAGTLRTASGLGQSARLCLAALMASDIDVRGIDITKAMMQPPDLPGDFMAQPGIHDLDDIRNRHDYGGAGTLLLFVNSPVVPLAMMRLGRHLVQHKRIIGYWAWELPDVPADWRHGLPFVHEIWAPSTFTAKAVKSIADGRPVRIRPYPVAHGKTVQHRSGKSPATQRPFTVLVMFNAASSFERKNPLASIAAFRKAFGEDSQTRLIIKTSNLSTRPHARQLLTEQIAGAANISIIDHVLSSAEIDALYADSDVIMSLHRSEGFGLVIAEAMLRGLPVIATDWSSSVDFLSSETGIPVPFRLVPAHDPVDATYHHPDMVWADPDVDAAAAALRRLRDNPALAEKLGRAASEFAADIWSTERYVHQFRDDLDGGNTAA